MIVLLHEKQTEKWNHVIFYEIYLIKFNQLQN